MTTTAVKERPILFSSPMVRAILDGRKVQTRRIVRPQPETYAGESGTQFEWPGWHGSLGAERFAGYCPHGHPGDRLWVRETFAADVPGCEFQGGYSYRADHLDPRGDGPANPMRWTPAIHMPRRASRITLEIVGVKVERLASISPEDALAEGIESYAREHGLSGYWTTAFARLWDEINGGKEGCAWKDDPFVWAISFRRIKS